MSVLLIILLALPVAGSRLPVSDPILDGLVRDAVANNFDLRAAAARVREARALRGITAARGKPQVAGDASAFKVERSIAVPGFGDRRLDIYDAGFDASWELDLFGGIRHDREAALAQVQATDEERRDLQITLTAEVARNYVELRGAQKRLDVLDARIQTLRDTLDIVRSRQAAGLTNELDTTRSEALLEDTLAARPSLEYAAASAIHRVGVLPGRQPGELAAQLSSHAPIPTAQSEIAAPVPIEAIE